MKLPAAVWAVVTGMALAALATADAVRTYKLKIVAPSAASVHGKYLSIQPNGDVGVYLPSGVIPDTKAGRGLVPPLAPALANDDAAPAAVPTPARFTVSPSKSQHYELHTYPAGIVDHALALNGTARLLRLRDVANPATAQSGAPEGYTLDWQSFTVGSLGNGDRAGSSVPALAACVPPALLANNLSYAGSTGRWVLIQQGPGSYAAAWHDGISIIAQNFRPVDVAIVDA